MTTTILCRQRTDLRFAEKREPIAFSHKAADLLYARVIARADNRRDVTISDHLEYGEKSMRLEGKIAIVTGQVLE